MSHLDRWNKMARPPQEALKTIGAGRLKGKSDINPQWRYKVLTDVYGPCGEGWKWEVVRLWTEPGTDGQVFAFAHVNLFVLADAGTWSAPIPGVGGHFLVVKESSGLHANDEAYKMAVTDALGTAMKLLGVAADIYAGLWDGTKYKEPGSRWEGKEEPQRPAQPQRPQAPAQPPQQAAVGLPCPACPKCSGPMWDNRADKASGKVKPTFPDAKCKDKACGGVVWDVAKAAAPKPPAASELPMNLPPDGPPAGFEAPPFDPNDDVPF